MKICLYLEFLNFWNGILYKKIGTGLLSSYKNQRRILETAGLAYRERWDPDCDILMINTPWLKSLYLIKKAKRQGKKVIIWSHVTAEDAREVFWFTKFVFSPFKKYLIYAYGLADIVLCPSEYTRGLLLAYGLPAEKLVVQSNGVNVRQFYRDTAKRDVYRERYGLEGLAVGTVGLVIPRKGTDTFLRLAERTPSAKFMWYGKIYSGLMVKPLPADLPANACFTGYVDDVVAAFGSLDIFLFPSYEENEGMAILEAAAVGLPILVRDIPVYTGWLRHNENCLKAKNDEEFAGYLNQLLRDRELRERLGRNARETAKQNDLAVLAEKLRVLFGQLISAR